MNWNILLINRRWNALYEIMVFFILRVTSKELQSRKHLYDFNIIVDNAIRTIYFRHLRMTRTLQISHSVISMHRKPLQSSQRRQNLRSLSRKCFDACCKSDSRSDKITRENNGQFYSKIVSKGQNMMKNRILHSRM